MSISNTLFAICFSVSAIIALGADSASAAESTSLVPLEGAARFRFGDDMAWVSSSYDDSTWDTVAVPESWVSRTDPYCLQLAGCYRFAFSLPAAAESWANPTLSVGVVSDAAEVYFNGTKIGGQGRMLPAVDGLPHDPLVLEVPHELLRVGQRNVVAIRVHRAYFVGGIVQGPVVIGSQSSVDRLVAPVRLWAWFVDGATVSFGAIAFVYVMLLYFAGVHESVYKWLFASTAFVLIAILLESRLVTVGLGPSALRRTLDLWVNSLAPLTLHGFIAAFFARRVPQRTWLIQGAVALLLLLITPFPRFFTAVVAIWTLYFLVLLAIWLNWGIRAVRTGVPDAWPLFVGLVVAATTFVGEIAGMLPIISGHFASTLSLLFFYGCGMVAITNRYQRTRRRAQQATIAIVSAHEAERSRIARELHDGVVQSLLAVQLKLQMLRGATTDNESADTESLDSVISELRTASDELRRVSHNLRPEALERLDLADAIRLHARELEERVGFAIHVSLDEFAIPSHLKDNLYRIYQEALFNAVKHAKAEQVHVGLERVGDRVTMVIQDNGCGFDPIQQKDGRRGVGLTTIRERVDLLGGQAQISSSSAGTTITVDLPVSECL